MAGQTPFSGSTAGRSLLVDREPPSWQVRLPLILVCLLLLALVVVAVLVHGRTHALQNRLYGLYLPARMHADEVEFALAREMSALRGYLLTRDEAFLDRFEAAHRVEERAHVTLERLATAIGPPSEQRVRELLEASERWHAHASGPDPTSGAGVERMATDQVLYEEALAAALALQLAINRAEVAVWEDISTAENLDLALTALFVLLTLGAALLVGWTARRARQFAIRLRRRAAEDARFRDLARALAAAQNAESVAAALVTEAPALTHASGAFVERLDDFGRELRVIAAGGEGVPPVGTRRPYAGSLGLRAIQSAEVRVVTVPDAALAGDAPAGSSALVVPLVGDGQPFGTLILVRTPALPPFQSDGLGRLRVLADFASLAMRRVTLLEETERRRREVEASEQRFRSLFLYSPDAVYELDLEGRYMAVNPAAERISGYTAEELLEMTWRDLILWKDQQHVEQRFRRAIAGDPQHFEAAIRRKDGREVELRGVKLPIRIGGRIVGVYGLAEDITARKRAERERMDLLARERAARADADGRRQEVERLMESKARLIRGFSHDLKNPLGAVGGYAELLESGIKGELTEEQRESISRIRHATRSMLVLVNDLLELSRAEAGRLELDCDATDIADVVRRTVEENALAAEGAGLDLSCSIDDLPTAHTDASRVQQVLGNLLSNAIKYTATGGRIDVRASLRTGLGGRGAPRWIAIEVTDTGPGIPRADQERIFEEFARLEPGTRHGTGLGLAISRRIAHLLGGDITVRSRVGIGSTFTLWLPTATTQRLAS